MSTSRWVRGGGRGRRTRAAGVLLVLALGGTVGCGSSEPTVPPQLAALRDTPAPGAPTPAASAQPPATPAPPKVPNLAELKAALLGAEDVPPGLSVDRKWNRVTGIAATDAPECASLVQAIRSTYTGLVAEAHIAFMVGSMEGVFTEDLLALPTPEDARGQLAAVRDAIRTCREITLEADEGDLPLTVAEASAPSVGDEQTGVRVYIDDPNVDFDITVLFIATGPVLLSTSGVEVEPSDLTAFTEDAYAKLTTGQVPNKDAQTGDGSGGSRGPGQPA